MFDLKSVNIKKAAYIFIAIAGTFLGMYLIYKLSYFVAPFIIAFIISLMVDPLVRLLTKKLRFPRKLAAGISLLLVLLILGSVLTLVILRLIAEIRAIYSSLPQFFTDLKTGITAWISQADKMIEWLPEEISANIGDILTNLSRYLTNLVDPIIKGAVVSVFAIPEVLIFILVTIVSIFFFTSDKEKMLTYFRTQLPEKWVHQITRVKSEMFSALFGYIRAQLILMCITFIELFIGFSIIHIKYNLLLAFIISLVDALPILGTGGIIIPWAIYSALTGNLGMGISLVILYGVVLVVRQSIEPKVLGSQIGMHPLTTLVTMYVGLKLIGFPGLILGPVTALLLKTILSGVLKGRSLKEYFEKDS